MAGHKKIIWTEDQIEFVRTSVHTMTNEKIGEFFGVTATTISVLCKRKDIKREKFNIFKLVPQKRVYEKSFDEPTSRSVSMFNIKPNQCRWIVGEPKSAMCCGKRITLPREGRQRGSYCAEHARICYTGF